MSSAERHPSPSSSHEIDKDNEPFGVGNVDEIREQQADLIKEELGKVKDPFSRVEKKEAFERAIAKFDAHAKKYLLDRHSATDEEELERMVQYIRHYSIDNTTEDEWLYPRVDKTTGEVSPSARQEVARDYAGDYKPVSSEEEPVWPTKDEDEEPVWPTKDPDEDPTTKPETKPEEGEEGKEDDPKPTEEETTTETKEEPPKPKTPEEVKAIVDAHPEVMAARANVDRLRTELAALSARRQGRLFNREGGKLQQEYDAKQTEYETALSDLIRLEQRIENEAGLEKSEGQKHFDAAMKLIDNFKKLQEQSVEMLKNTKVGRFIEFMNKGGTFKRILKGVGLGVAVGVVGAAITAFTAGTGVGAVGAGLATAGALAGRFARGFATADAQRGEGMAPIDGGEYMTQLVGRMEAGGGDSRIDAAHRILMDKFEADTKTEQGKRRRSTYIAMGSIAVGSILAYGANELVDKDWGFGTGHNKGAHDLLWNDEVQGKAVPVEHVEMKTIIPERTFGAEALSINPGEGWYQTFQDLGVPQKDWPALLNKVGPELQGVKVNGMDLAYRMPDNQWGIRMTPDKAMPKEALTAIMNAYDQMTGVSTAPTAIEVPVEAPAAPNTPNIPAPAAEAPAGVPNLETVTPADRSSVESIIMKDVISPSDIANTPAFDKITTIASWYDPDWIGQKLELPAADWNKLEEYIIGQVQTQDNPLYTQVFNVDQRGYLHFNNIREIPDTAMADMINQAKRLSSVI